MLLAAAADVAPDPGASEQGFFMLVGMFVLGCVVLAFVIRWYGQWRSPIEQKMMGQEEACEFLADLMSRRLGASLLCANLDALTVEHFDRMPPEYRPALIQQLRMTQILEETMYNEAVSRGIYPKRVTTNGPLLPPPPAETPLADAYIQAPPASAEVSRVVPIRGRTWVGGQLLRSG